MPCGVLRCPSNRLFIQWTSHRHYSSAVGGNNTKIANIKKKNGGGGEIKLVATIDQKRTRQFGDCDSVEGNQLVNISIVYHTRYGQVFYLFILSVSQFGKKDSKRDQTFVVVKENERKSKLLTRGLYRCR